MQQQQPRSPKDWERAWAQRWAHSNHRFMGPTPRQSRRGPAIEACPASPRSGLWWLYLAAAVALAWIALFT